MGGTFVHPDPTPSGEKRTEAFKAENAKPWKTFGEMNQMFQKIAGSFEALGSLEVYDRVLGAHGVTSARDFKSTKDALAAYREATELLKSLEPLPDDGGDAAPPWPVQ